MNKRKRLINFKTIFSATIVILLIIVVIVLVIMNNNPVYNESYFKSDNTKIALLLNDEYPEDDEANPIKTYIVYYSGDAITGVKQFYLFKSDETAKNALEKAKELDMGWVQEITRSGSYIIFELAKDQYEGITVTQIRESIESIDALNNDGSDVENDEMSTENDDIVSE